MVLSGTRFSWSVRGAALLIVVGFMGVLFSWQFRTPPGFVSSGLYQGDMVTYLCYARMAARSPTLITYANPHDLRDPPPPVFVNLPITMMGAMLRGMSPAWVENVLRFVFGVGMYLALAAMLERMFGRGRWFWSAFLLTGVGAGMSWSAALSNCPSGNSVASCVAAVESGHYWWALSLLRNLMYPLELVYHVVLFAQLAALMDQRLQRANWLFLLGIVSNPFLGIQMLGAQLVCALTIRQSTPLQRWSAFAIAASLFIYYGAMLPLDPVAASFQRQHQAGFAASLGLTDLVLGHGISVLGLLALLQPSFRRWLLAQRYGIPLAAFTLWTLLLTQNSRLGGSTALMPMHFARGYLATGMVCLLLLWLQRTAAAMPALATWTTPLLATWVLVAMPDNLFFLGEQWRVPPAIPLLTQPTAAHDAVDFLSRQPTRRRVLTLDTDLSRNICAMTGHRVIFGTDLTTPEFQLRRRQAWEFRANAAEARDLDGYSVDTVVVPVRDTAWLLAQERNPAWTVAYRNAGCSIFFRNDGTP